jgi:hypothetical protein
LFTVSSSAVRSIVETQGKAVLAQQASGDFSVGFTSENCTGKTMITGVDGVMVPHVTQEQKTKRHQTEKAKRKDQSLKSTAKRGRPRKGSDGPYKEFKIVTFYDTDKKNKHVVGTRGNHHKLGRLMRREAHKLKLISDNYSYFPVASTKNVTISITVYHVNSGAGPMGPRFPTCRIA